MSSSDGREAVAAPAFQSVLFKHDGDAATTVTEAEVVSDLRLDQVFAALTAGREEYDLVGFLYRPLDDVEAVHYRHHVLGDLERAPVRAAVREFAESMRQMRRFLGLVEKLHYPRQRQRWFLEAAHVYGRAVSALTERLKGLEFRSQGFRSLRDYLNAYVQSEAFTSFADDTDSVEEQLALVRYAVHLRGNRVRVIRYEGEPDLSSEIERTFEKFEHGAAADYRVRFREQADMNHVEAQILDLVAKLYPDTFAGLEQFCARHQGYLDAVIERFDREVQFYLAYLEHIEPLKRAGLSFTLPSVSPRSRDITATDTFDLALAAKLIRDGAHIVCNDFHLSDPERILVISGPNNGGKTTFARTFGQLHYLASLGLPVPGANVRVSLPDRIFTHFEREEDIETLRGKFEDELHRIREILAHATSQSVLIMNESFGSTTLRDAVLVGGEVVGRIIDLDALCVFVTFVDELSAVGESTVSMMSTVVPGDPAVRTFKIVRKPADGLAYATAIAEKYGLTYEAMRKRVGR